MAPFSIPAPSIIPLRVPIRIGYKTIDTNTKIQLLCETYLDHEIFYTLDGTKPQPYSGIVQGSKLIKYCSPFCLPSGKITVKAIAINKNVHTMCSNVITKSFEVLKGESLNNNKPQAKVKQTENTKVKTENDSIVNENNVCELENIQNVQKPGAEILRCNNDGVKDEDILECFDQAFIGDSEFDTENSDIGNSTEDENSLPILNNNDVCSNNVQKSDDIKLCDVGFANKEKDSICEDIEEIIHENKNEPNITLTTDTAVTVDTQFCCLKCDLTLQQCISCNKMNGVSSKFCIGCGKQLSRICSVCSEYNPSLATFCQYCGNKLNSKSCVKVVSRMQTDHSIMVKPESKNAASQMFPVMVDRSTQTITEKSPVKKNLDLKRMPHYSPGRGYWHQQMDYICNHLKSHAYNNVEFRKEISEPMLCDFKSAHITKDEDNVTVAVVFSLLKDKNNFAALYENKSKEGENARKVFLNSL